MTRSDRLHAGKWGMPLLKLVLTVAVTWLILRGAGVRLAEAWSVDWTLVQLNLPLLALSVGLLFVTFAIGAAMWRHILLAFGEARITVTQGAAILLIAGLGRYVPGKIAQLAGLAVLARRRGMSGIRATTASVTTQVINLLGAAAVGGWIIFRSAGLLGEGSLAAGLAIVVGLAAFLYFGGVGVVLRWILRRSGHTGELPHPDGRRLLLLLPASILNWLVYGAAFVCLSRGLGLEIGFGEGTSAFATAYFAGYVVLFAPAGIGVREGALVSFLAPTLGGQAAIVLAALQRVWITATELAGAAVGAFVLRAAAADAGTAATGREVGDPLAGGTR